MTLLLILAVQLFERALGQGPLVGAGPDYCRATLNRLPKSAIFLPC